MQFFQQIGSKQNLPTLELAEDDRGEGVLDAKHNRPQAALEIVTEDTITMPVVTLVRHNPREIRIRRRTFPMRDDIDKMHLERSGLTIEKRNEYPDLCSRLAVYLFSSIFNLRNCNDCSSGVYF